MRRVLRRCRRLSCSWKNRHRIRRHISPDSDRFCAGLIADLDRIERAGGVHAPVPAGIGEIAVLIGMLIDTAPDIDFRRDLDSSTRPPHWSRMDRRVGVVEIPGRRLRADHADEGAGNIREGEVKCRIDASERDIEAVVIEALFPVEAAQTGLDRARRRTAADPRGCRRFRRRGCRCGRRSRYGSTPRGCPMIVCRSNTAFDREIADRHPAGFFAAIDVAGDVLGVAQVQKHAVVL